MTIDERIVVFAKPAKPGTVKTRLIPPLSAAEAADFHLALLADVLSVARGIAGERVELWVAGNDRDVEAFLLRYPGLTVRCQVGRDLGERLTRAFDDCFSRGADRVLVLGSDHPTIPATYLRQLLRSLDESDIGFGPSRDGGYYAVAIRRESWPRASAALQDIPWSTERVLERSLEQARRAGLQISLAEEWYDVDRPEDLERLRQDMQPDSAVAGFLHELQRRRV